MSGMARFQIFLEFSPRNLGEDFHFDEHIFQLGRFSHQPGFSFCDFWLIWFLFWAQFLEESYFFHFAIRKNMKVPVLQYYTSRGFSFFFGSFERWSFFP